MTFYSLSYILILVDVDNNIWAHSSVGRASALQAGGHRFESYCAHHFIVTVGDNFIGPVAQLVRALACHARGRGFEPLPGRQIINFIDNFFFSIYALVAQSVEQGTENPRVGGSIPPQGTI